MAVVNSEHVESSDNSSTLAPREERIEIPDSEKQQASEDQPSPEEQKASPRDVHGWKWALASIAILSSIFLYALDATVVADIQAIIVSEFDSLGDLSWVSVGFLMSATATNMVWGRIYSQFNSKWLYIFNVALFEVGSALCGAAPNINAMIVGRVICGVGGAGLYVGVMTLISVSTTLAERPLYISGTGFSWGLGIVLGPVIGGGFEESAVGWRWAFYINLFIGAAAAPAYFLLLPSVDPRPGVPYRERLAELDYAGMVLLMGGLVSFVMAINWGGITYPWDSGRIIGLFVTAGVLFILLAVQQVWTVTTTLPRRLLPVQFFRSRTILLLFAATGASAAAVFIPIYFVPLFFQFTRGDGALDAGVRLLPLIVVLVAAIFLNGAFLAKTGYYMPWYLGGGLLCVAGGALMYTVDRDTSASAIYGYTVLIGVGVGMWIQTAFSVVQAVVEPDNIAPAIGFITLAQFLGNTISLAIANSVFLNDAEAGIKELLPNIATSTIRAAMTGASSGFVESLGKEMQRRVLDVVVDSISKTYILVITPGALVAVLDLLMKREKLFVGSDVHAA